MASGLLLGVLIFVALLILFTRLPKPIKNLLAKHHLFTDFTSFVLAYVLLSSVSHSATTLIATSITGVLTSLSIEIARYNRGYTYEKGGRS